VRRAKGSRRIVVRGVEYRWRARGDDGYISVGACPNNGVGAYLRCTLRYHETWLDAGAGVLRSAGDQIVVTPGLVRQIIEHALTAHNYDPHARGHELNLGCLDSVLALANAVRARRT